MANSAEFRKAYLRKLKTEFECVRGRDYVGETSAPARISGVKGRTGVEATKISSHVRSANVRAEARRRKAAREPNEAREARNVETSGSSEGYYSPTKLNVRDSKRVFRNNLLKLVKSVEPGNEGSFANNFFRVHDACVSSLSLEDIDNFAAVLLRKGKFVDHDLEVMNALSGDGDVQRNEKVSIMSASIHDEDRVREDLKLISLLQSLQESGLLHETLSTNVSDGRVNLARARVTSGKNVSVSKLFFPDTIKPTKLVEVGSNGELKLVTTKSNQFDGAEGNFDNPTNWFGGGLVSHHLRAAEKSFGTALDCSIKLVNVRQQISTRLDHFNDI